MLGSHTPKHPMADFLWKPLLGCINQIKAAVRMLNDSPVAPNKALEGITVCSCQGDREPPLWDLSSTGLTCQPPAGHHLGHTQPASSWHKHLTGSLPSHFNFLHILRKYFKQHLEVKQRAGKAGSSPRE